MLTTPDKQLTTSGLRFTTLPQPTDRIHTVECILYMVKHIWL